jgi:selenide,water dikinase
LEPTRQSPFERIQLARKLPPDGDADHHSEARLFCEERAESDQALGWFVDRGDLRQRLLTRGVEPAALRQHAGKDLLELGRGGGDAPLRFAEAARLEQGLDRGPDIGVGIGHAAIIGRTLTTAVPLTSLSHGAGCACKIGPRELHALISTLPDSRDPALLVGSETADDAGVYRLSDDLALVQTVDFFTPIVDDPFDFGRIAAANALSDVYAMGARPLTALNLVAYSLDQLGTGALGEILRGGAEIAAEAGVSIVGGHSIDDPEPKYGMAVTGVVHPQAVVRNSTGRPGDRLFLTKPLGAGAVSTAAKRGDAGPDLVQRATDVMTTLNAGAAEAAVAVGPSAMTDVTGFGLLGHLRELCAASGVSARIEAGAVPAIEGVVELLERGKGVSGGSRRNSEFAAAFTTFGEAVSDALRALVADPMTSGGLLVAVAPERAGEMGELLKRVAPATAAIGSLEAAEPGAITVE